MVWIFIDKTIETNKKVQIANLYRKKISWLMRKNGKNKSYK